MANLDKVPVKTLADDLIREKTDVNDLNLAVANQRDAFLQALKTHPKLLRKVKPVNAKHFISFALQEDYEYFVCLDQQQYTEAFLQFYLSKRLETENEQTAFKKESASELLAQKSLDEKLVFRYIYTTPEDEAFCYYDAELKIPLSIKSAFKITLKLASAMTFLKKLDLEPSQLGSNKIRTVLSDLIGNAYREYLSDYISENKIGYYELCASIADLENGLVKALNKSLDAYGIEVNALSFKNLAIPKDIQYRLEDQAFHIRQRRADIEADAEFAKISLENYETKLSLEEKYPNATHSLTEYEKDLALKRYLIKTGRLSKDALDHSIDIAQDRERKDSTIEKTDTVPDVVPKHNLFKKYFFCLLFVFVAVSIVVMASGSFGVGCILFAATSAIFGTVAAFFPHKFKTPAVEIKEGDNEYVENQQ